MRVLLVEDDAMIGHEVLRALRDAHHAADWVRDGVAAEAAWRAEAYDLVLLDLGLPRRDGLETLRRSRPRQQGTTLPLEGGEPGRRGRHAYGAEHVRSRITNLWDGVTPAAGSPEVFPLKRFPDTRETSSAAYLQAEWLSDRWSVVPGLRLDHFALDVLTQDGFFLPAAQPGRSLSGTALCPKLGVMYRATDAWSVFGSYAGGFRAPNAHQINGPDCRCRRRPWGPPGTQFTIPHATTVDLSAQWRIRKDLRLTASVINLTNRKYWVWADVRGLAAASPATDAYTQPGRHARLSLVKDF